MWTFFARRLLSIPPLLLVISFLTFLLMQASGGDYYQRVEEDPKFSYDYVMELRRAAGKVIEIAKKDRAATIGEFVVQGRRFSFTPDGHLLEDGAPAEPRALQAVLKRFETANGDRYSISEVGRTYRWVGALRGYSLWLGNVLEGDFGRSYTKKEDVWKVIRERMLNTFLLGSTSLVLAWGIAIPLGVWSGVRPNSPLDHVCGLTAYLGLSVPTVFLALLALLFASYTGWFPVGDMRDKEWDSFGALRQWTDIAWHLVLPASVVAVTSLAGTMRQMRGQMVETMSADYVRTARAKGVSERSVTFVHALRNAINPLVTLFGFSIAALLSGSFLVEVVLNWPGLATTVVDAVINKDEPLVMAAILMSAVLLVMGNLFADLLLAIVDPRIRVA